MMTHDHEFQIWHANPWNISKTWSECLTLKAACKTIWMSLPWSNASIFIHMYIRKALPTRLPTPTAIVCITVRWCCVQHVQFTLAEVYWRVAVRIWQIVNWHLVNTSAFFTSVQTKWAILNCDTLIKKYKVYLRWKLQ